jgi:ADP-heptose:LPS heptosyltransferase
MFLADFPWLVMFSCVPYGMTFAREGAMRQRNTRILIVLIAGIGDLVLASRGIRAIRNGHPEAEIHLLTSADAAPLARNYDYIDGVTVFPIREWKAGKLRLTELIGVMKKLRRWDSDLAVNLYAADSPAGAFRMGCLLILSGAAERVGIDSNGLGRFLTTKVSPSRLSGRHVADAMVEIARSAGGVADDRGIEVFWNPAVEERCRRLVPARADDRQRVIGINPGGNRRNRRWSPKNFAATADRLIEEEGADIVLLGGPTETDIAEAFLHGLRHDVVNLSGKLNLDELACVVSRLDVLITNDSAPMHIAAAIGTPQVTLFGPEDPAAFHPYADPGLYAIACSDIDCRPCRKEECENLLCLDLITPELVFEKCRRLLRAGSRAIEPHGPDAAEDRKDESHA